ncbi:MAG TPA: hypothetical protein VEM94_09695, partial [Candidatus Dormibacteraeota bacterium]|nr:hypothetical protein [Candidatus Dormibacteraeota bacterium]
THVPANQAGEVQLWSVVNTYFFASDANGDMTLDMTVPSDIELGNHVVKICWAGTCQKQAPLRVVSGVAGIPSSTPVANNTPGASPTTSPSPGSTPRPGSSPTPRSTPTSGSTPHSTSTPRSNPSSTPTPQPTSPPPPPTPALSLKSVTTTTLTFQGKTTVTFQNFTGSATVKVCQQAAGCKAAGNIFVGSTGQVSFNTPSGIVSLVQTWVVACVSPCLTSNKVVSSPAL